MKNILSSDPRYYQIICLSSFLFLGVFFCDFSLNFLSIVTVFSICLLTQLVFIYLFKSSENKINFSSLKSALITSLSLSLLLRTNSPLIFILAGICAISSKFILKTEAKHFFNPANFGIIIALFFTNSAWVSSGQWGNDYLFLILFVCSGLLVINRVGRWETSIIFLIGYGILEGIYYQFYLGWHFDVLLHHLSNGSLFIFAFFMLSDPRSIPDAKIARIIWALLIAIVSFLLAHFFYINESFFWGLFIISPTTIIFDKIWQSPRFTWQNHFPLIKIIMKPDNSSNFI